MEKKNLAESVYARLKNLALAKKRPVQEVLRYYAMERFLYRLSLSPYQEIFFLKGGLMLMVWSPNAHRATIDIDLLAKTANSKENILRILTDICSYPAPRDGVVFDVTGLILRQSQIEAHYTGFSVRFLARLHTAKLPLRIDLGFSDKIFPKPDLIYYPSLLGFPSPSLQGYTPETMIAEKLDAIVKLGFANSRMKDFYDIWTLINQFAMKPKHVTPVIRDVFRNRKTLIREVPKAFSEDFYRSSKTVERWNGFLQGIKENPIPFEKVVLEIKEFFTPIFAQLGDFESMVH